jgi:hypothetical protein
LESYRTRYDELLCAEVEENRHTKGRIAKKEEKALLKRLKKYKENHLLFLSDFHIPYSNNMSLCGGAKTARKWQVDSEQPQADRCIAKS